MKRVPIEQAKPGMILAQKMLRHDGVMLCQKGSELTEGLISMLSRMNFETIPIEEENTESPEERTARLNKAERILQARFSRVKGDAVLDALRLAILKQIRDDQ